MNLSEIDCGHGPDYKADFLTENTVEYFGQIFNLASHSCQDRLSKIPVTTLIKNSACTE